LGLGSGSGLGISTCVDTLAAQRRRRGAGRRRVA
jgi:hypothetical protein